MNVQQLLEYFRQLPSSTQIAVIVVILVLVLVIVIFPTAGTNIMTFLLGLRALTGR